MAKRPSCPLCGAHPMQRIYQQINLDGSRPYVGVGWMGMNPDYQHILKDGDEM